MIISRKWKIGWGVTSLCNMSCPFCYSEGVRDSSREVSVDVAKNFLDINHEWIDSINFGTSENTLSNTFFDLLFYTYTNYNDIPQSITTNGYLAKASIKNKNTEKVLEALSEVDISLDFHNPDLHNEFRGNSKAYKWAIESAYMCKDANIPTTFVVLGIDKTLQKDNLVGIFELAEKFGFYVRINIFRPNNHQNVQPLSFPILKNSLLWLVQDGGNFQATYTRSRASMNAFPSRSLGTRINRFSRSQAPAWECMPRSSASSGLEISAILH